MTANEPSTIRKELAKFKVEVDALRAQGVGGATTTAPRVEVPCPEANGGARKVREFENFLYELEQYFDVLGIVSDDARLRMAPLYLKDSVLIRWRQKCDEGRRGEDTITT